MRLLNLIHQFRSHYNFSFIVNFQKAATSCNLPGATEHFARKKPEQTRVSIPKHMFNTGFYRSFGYAELMQHLGPHSKHTETIRFIVLAFFGRNLVAFACACCFWLSSIPMGFTRASLSANVVCWNNLDYLSKISKFIPPINRQVGTSLVTPHFSKKASYLNFQPLFVVCLLYSVHLPRKFQPYLTGIRC